MADILSNNLSVIRFINAPVSSNAFIVIDGVGKNAIVIDPGSKDQSNIIEFLNSNNITLDYIILTHEHFDHCWGTNQLVDEFHPKVVATSACAKWINTPMNYFNKLYFDSDEIFSIPSVDIVIEEIGYQLQWQNENIDFIPAKGHTDKGMCVNLGNGLFSGDTLIFNTKPFLKKKYGASKKDLKETIEFIYHNFEGDTIVFPGHGRNFLLKEMETFYINYFQSLDINGPN